MDPWIFVLGLKRRSCWSFFRYPRGCRWGKWPRLRHSTLAVAVSHTFRLGPWWLNLTVRWISLRPNMDRLGFLLLENQWVQTFMNFISYFTKNEYDLGRRNRCTDPLALHCGELVVTSRWIFIRCCHLPFSPRQGRKELTSIRFSPSLASQMFKWFQNWLLGKSKWVRNSFYFWIRFLFLDFFPGTCLVFATIWN